MYFKTEDGGLMKEHLNWMLSYSDEEHGNESDRYSATVPGCVQFDTAKELGIPSIYTGNHEKEYEWMENKFWHYRTNVPVKDNDKLPFLCFKGVEYKYEVIIDGKTVLSHEGMFTETSIALSDYLGKTISIEVIIFPAPKRNRLARGRGYGDEASESCKPPFSYSWDWCPRFVTLGISDDAYIEYRPVTHFTNVDVSYILTKNYDKAKITVTHSESSEGLITYSLINPQGEEIQTGEIRNSKYLIEFANPELWWPNGYGKQPIYTLIIILKSDVGIDVRTIKIGFRQVKLVVNDGAWDEPSTPVKTCSKPPMTIQINGRKIFGKGSNWVPPELCRSQLSEKSLRTKLLKIIDLNMNIIRMWGGGYIHPDYFYDMCDELGIMIWQEFTLACSKYSEDDSYLSVLKQESSAIIHQLRNHPSLVLWCGGNELFNQWSKMTPQSKALRLLDSLTYELDPETPFIMASPQYGVAHGSYDMIGTNGRELLTDFCEGGYTAYTEFGCGSPSELDYLKTFMSDEDINSPITQSTWRARHASGSCDFETRWFDIEAIKKISGCNDNLKDIIDSGNEIQCLMYQCLFEEVRRQWPKASLAINWCFNEPWPTAAGNAILNYPDKPRSCYYGIKEALKDTKLSLRFSKLGCKSGEKIEIEPWLLNDSDNILSKGEAIISIVCNNLSEKIGKWDFGITGPRTNQKGEKYTISVPDNSTRFILKIESFNYPNLYSEYNLFINH